MSDPTDDRTARDLHGGNPRDGNPRDENPRDENEASTAPAAPGENAGRDGEHAPPDTAEGDARIDPQVDEGRRALNTWLWRLPVLLAVGGGAWGVWRAGRVHFVKPRASNDPTFTPGEAVAVAPLAEFGAVWDTREFVYAGIPAIAARLPEPVPGGVTVATGDGPQHLIAFSRVCTHQGCIVRLARDTEAVAVATNYRSDGPSLFCGCHLSVFAPLQGGRAVAGPAQQPLPRVRLELREGAAGGVVTATGLERTG